MAILGVGPGPRPSRATTYVDPGAVPAQRDAPSPRSQRAASEVDGYGSHMDNDKLEAVQNVVDRISSYEDGAPEGTVEKELRAGLDEAGIELDGDQVTALADAVEKDAGDVRVSAVLG